MVADFYVLEGDRRAELLSRLLRRDFTVATGPTLAECKPGQFRRIVLPAPSLGPDGQLRGVRSADLPVLQAAEAVYGGALGPEGERLKTAGVRVSDLLQDPVAVVENARLTAEAALLLAMQRTEQSLFGQSCAVIGCGRIGQLLGARLAALGAEVIAVSAHGEKRALAEAAGLSAAPPEALAAADPQLVFNTAPAQLVPDAALTALPGDCLWFELASAPGGLPGTPLPFPVVKAGGLPGRLLPVSAAAVLLRAILRTM